MRICLIGGIYGKDEQYRSALDRAPEVILETGLRALGHEVATFSHYECPDFNRFDVIHVHHLSFGAITAAADRSNVPFVFTAHDGTAIAGALSWTRATAMAFVMSRADAVVALSKLESEFQRSTYNLDGAIHYAIPNGVSDEYTYGRTNSAGKDRPWLLFYAGQLIELKRVEVLLRSIAMLPPNVELNLAYHVATLEPQLRRLAAELGIGDRVRFLGPKSLAELKLLYQSADVFVLPSSRESLPSVISEAMLCGTPVVATDVGGVREQLGRFGVIVHPGNADQLANGLRHLLDNFARYAAEGEAMSRSARERFSIDHMVQAHVALYRDLAVRSRPVRRNAAARRVLGTITGWAGKAMSGIRSRRRQNGARCVIH